MLVKIAKLWRAKFKKMRRLGGGRKFWGKRRINRIYSQHSGKLESYERTVYGVLLMVEDKGFQEPKPSGAAQREDFDCR